MHLYRWSAVDREHNWKALLVGNGLSMNVSKGFDYESLYEEADKSTEDGSLTDEDQEIFELFATKNFEIVLGKLRDAIQLGGSSETRDPARGAGSSPRRLSRYPVILMFLPQAG